METPNIQEMEKSMSPPESRNGFFRTRPPTAAILVVLGCWSIAGLGCRAATDEKSTDNEFSGDPPRLMANENAEQPEKRDFDVGETAKFGKVEIKINAVKRGYVSESSAPNQGMEQVLLNMTLNNTGMTGMCIYQAELAINYGGEDLGHNKYVEEINGEGGSGASDDCLKPKKPITRDVVYEIPTGAHDLKLQYETNQIVGGDSDKGTVGFKKTIYTLAF